MRLTTANILSLLAITAFMSFFTHGSEASQTSSPDYTDSSCVLSVKRLRECYQRPPEDWPEPTIDEGIEFIELGLIPAAKEVYGRELALQRLGEQLFFDPILSGSGQIACASCHHPDERFADGRKRSTGHNMQHGRRNSPSLLNTGLHSTWFWAGRAESLEAQAIEPILNPVEMAGDRETIERRLNEADEYRSAFNNLFGDTPITLEKAATALASWQKTLRSRSAPFDRFLRGDHEALSDHAVLGLHLFRTKARCVNCHMGPLLSDGKFHNIGLTYYGRKLEDLGRYENTGDPDDVGRFKTPSLREVAATRPYMHNGVFPHLRGILAMYNGGAPRPKPKGDQKNDPLFPETSTILKPLNLTQDELDALESFLRSLTSGTGERRSVSTGLSE